MSFLDIPLDSARNYLFEQAFYMALLPILRFPNPRLKKIAAPITHFDEALRRLAEDMAETMYEAPGIGLAATQVDVHQQLIVIDVSETRDQLQVFINPEILSSEGEQIGEEGCLSIPGVYEQVKRAEHIVVRYFDLNGQARTLAADGLLAVCIQHEIDHLKGILFIERLSPLKLGRIKTRLAKQARITA